MGTPPPFSTDPFDSMFGQLFKPPIPAKAVVWVITKTPNDTKLRDVLITSLMGAGYAVGPMSPDGKIVTHCLLGLQVGKDGISVVAVREAVQAVIEAQPNHGVVALAVTPWGDSTWAAFAVTPQEASEEAAIAALNRVTVAEESWGIFMRRTDGLPPKLCKTIDHGFYESEAMAKATLTHFATRLQVPPERLVAAKILAGVILPPEEAVASPPDATES